MPEQINLSDALSLIESSKADIKTSVENKGGTIGDDLTQYSNSIENIQFNYLHIDGTQEPQYLSSTGFYNPMRYNASTYEYEYPDVETINVSVSPTEVKSDGDSTNYNPDCVNVNLEKEQGEDTVTLTITPATLGRADVLVHDSIGNTDICIHTVTQMELGEETGIHIDTYLFGNEVYNIEVDEETGMPNCTAIDGQELKLCVNIMYNGINITNDEYVNSLFTMTDFSFTDFEGNELQAPFDVTYDTTNHYIVFTPNENYASNNMLLNNMCVYFDGHSINGPIGVNFANTGNNSINIYFAH